MEDEFSLREYWQILIGRWRLIGLVTLAALLAATVVNLILPPSYEATVTLLVPKPRYDWRLEPRIPERVDIRHDPRDDVIALAETDIIAADVAQRLGKPKEEASALLSRIRIRKDKGQFIRLRARASTPEAALTLVNVWKDALLNQVTLHYSVQGNREELNAEKERLGKKLADIDAELEEFMKETGLGLYMSGDLATAEEMVYGAQSPLKQELTLRVSTLAAYQQALDHVQRLIAALDAGSTVTELPLGLLDLPLLRKRGQVTVTRIIELAADPAAVESLLRAEERALTAIVEELSAGVNATISRFAEGAVKLHRLSRERTVAEEMYYSVVRELIELDLRQKVEGIGVEVVAEAELPKRHVRPNWPLSLVLAGGLGLIVGVLFALATAYFVPPAEPDGDALCTTQTP